MAQSLSKIIVHAIFSTKDRTPLLRDRELREKLHHYLGGILNNLDCQPIIVGGVEDHVHILCSFSRTHGPSEIIKEVKRGSSVWMKDQAPQVRNFAWQSGYGVFSIGVSQIAAVRAYIAKQEEHHKKVSFQDEYRRFLQKYEIPFDERHVWD